MSVPTGHTSWECWVSERMDTIVIDIVWRAYLGGRKASAIGSKLRRALLIKSLTVTMVHVGRNGPGLCGPAVMVSRWGESLRAGRRWRGCQTGWTRHAWALHTGLCT